MAVFPALSVTTSVRYTCGGRGVAFRAIRWTRSGPQVGKQPLSWSRSAFSAETGYFARQGASGAISDSFASASASRTLPRRGARGPDGSKPSMVRPYPSQPLANAGIPSGHGGEGALAPSPSIRVALLANRTTVKPCRVEHPVCRSHMTVDELFIVASWGFPTPR
jgi:hypothetical protein